MDTIGQPNLPCGEGSVAGPYGVDDAQADPVPATVIIIPFSKFFEYGG